MPGDGAAPAAERELLISLRRHLLHLHKTLLEWERATYERLHGRVSSHEMLRLVLGHPQFGWLHPLSELIVRIDETLESDPPATAADLDVLLQEARALVRPDESGGRFAQRYHVAVQDHPDALLAHRGVSAALKKGEDAKRPGGGIH